MLRENERDFKGVILTQAFGSAAPGPERLDARCRVRHALKPEDREGPAGAAATMTPDREATWLLPISGPSVG